RESFRALFIYVSIISIPTYVPDNFSDFIFLANSAAYTENRQDRGLTRFPKIERGGKGAALEPRPWLFVRSAAVYLRRMAAPGRTAGCTIETCGCAAAPAPEELCA